MMHRATRLKITDVNPHLICILCGGYLVDATTMIECLHSYCRACIVAYLRQSRQCPICDTIVHKTRPLLNIRSDKTLQNLVYKLVPNLFKDEMKRRREFYAKHPQASTSMQSPNAREERGEVCEDSLVIYTDDEYISLSLDYYFPQPGKDKQIKGTNGNGNGNGKRPHTDTNGLPRDVVEKRYLRCPAAVCITHIKKFIRNKFGLSAAHRIEVVHQNGEDEPLRDDYTLMDIAYIYTWRRNGPLPLLFRVFEPLSKRRKGSQSSISSIESVTPKIPAQMTPSPPPAAPSQAVKSQSPSPLSLTASKDKDSQQSHTKVKTDRVASQLPAVSAKPPADVAGPSGKSAPKDGGGKAQSVKIVKPKQSGAVTQGERPSAPSATSVTPSATPGNVSGKTIIIVTSPKSAPASSAALTPNTCSSGVKISRTLTPVSAASVSSNSSKVDVSLNGSKPSPKMIVPSTQTDKMPSSAGVLTPKPSAVSQKLVKVTVSTPVTASPKKTGTSSPKLATTAPSSKPPSTAASPKQDVAPPQLVAAVKKSDITPPRPGTSPPKLTMASTKSDATSPKPSMTTPKPAMTSTKVSHMTSPKPVTIAPKPDTAPSKSPVATPIANVAISKPDVTSTPATATPKKSATSAASGTPPPVSLTSPGGVLPPTKPIEKSKEAMPADSFKSGNQTVEAIPDAVKAASMPRRDSQENKKSSTVPNGKEATADQNVQTKGDQPTTQQATAVVGRLNTDTTPTMSTTARDEPINVPVSDGVMIDRPVLLQT